MKIKNIKSSTVIISSLGTNVLCDPWLFDGEYYGSWYHYPPLTIKDEEFKSIDFIYLSHIHPDHFSRKSFNYLDKKIPVIIHRYESNFLKRNLELLGFNVIEVLNGDKFYFNESFYIQVYAADNCNPELCGKFFGCGIIEAKYGSTQIDSLAVFHDGNFTLVNVNDCPYDLSKKTLSLIQSSYKNIDFMLVGYAGAGPYPQCFNLDDLTLSQAIENKQSSFLQQSKNFIEHLAPKYFMPFAGTYILGGRLKEKNSLRGIPEIFDAKCRIEAMISTRSHGVLLNDYESFDLFSELSTNEYLISDQFKKEEYLEEILAKKIYDYEDDLFPSLNDFKDLLPGAFNRFLSKSKEIGYSSKTNVIIDLVEDYYLVFNVEEAIYRITKIVDYEDLIYLRLVVDPRLLLRIFKGPKFAHWNNASIGSHIFFDRSENKYDRGLHYCLNFLHN